MREVMAVQAATPHKQQEKGLARLKWALLGYLPGLALLALSAHWGLASWGSTLAILALASCMGVVCFTLLRTFWLNSKHDPMWVFPQVCTGYLIVALSFAYIPWTRIVASAWLFLIVAYDLRRLNKWQTRVVAALSATFPVWSLFIHWQAGMPAPLLRHELVVSVMSLLLVPSLFYISALARQLNRCHKNQQLQMAQVLARLRKLSAIDALTGLFNRVAMLRILRREMLRTQRSGLPFSLAMIDLDHFKQINDRFGHAVGDEVLRQFGELARQAARAGTDVAARWGGEEFLMFLPATTESESTLGLDRLRQLVQHHPWFRIDPQLSVTFSAGIAAHQIKQTLEETIHQADMALYTAKEKGRNQSVLASTLAAPAPCERKAPQPPRPVSSSPIQAVHALDNGWMLHATAAVEHSRPGKRSCAQASKLAQWVMGPDKSLHIWIHICLIASALYVCPTLSFIFYCLPAGLLTPQWTFAFVTASLIGALLPLILVRSGWTQHFADPGLVQAQILWGCLLCALGFAVIPSGRAYALQLLCVAMAFGLIHIQPRQAVATGGLVILAFVGIYFHEVGWTDTQGSKNLELRLQLLMGAMIIWLLTLQMRHQCRIRLGVSQEKQRLLATMEQVRQAIKFDPLTQLYNRQHMTTLIENEAARHERTGLGFCLALIDLDHFKSINDQMGHHAGDSVLKRFAVCAKERLRETDTLGRWGGEEFVLLVPDTTVGPQGMRAVERLREYVGGQRLCPEGSPHQVTFSAGVAIRRTGESIEHLFERADNALYAAKQQGRNRTILSQA